MIEIGKLVRWKDGSIGLVIEIHDTDHSKAYRIKWFDGGSGVLADWQFEVIA